MAWYPRELSALIATLRETDPNAPTLCEGWQARHLASHLYLRRHKPWQMGKLGTYAQRAEDPAEYQRIIDAFAEPVHAPNPLVLMDTVFAEAANLLEYVIHHEDVRRGRYETEPVTPRVLPAPMSDAVLAGAARFAKLGLRMGRYGLVFAVPEGRRQVVRRGAVSAAVVGTAPDLALVASGRARAAQVEVLGEPEAVAAFEAAAG